MTHPVIINLPTQAYLILLGCKNTIISNGKGFRYRSWQQTEPLLLGSVIYYRYSIITTLFFAHCLTVVTSLLVDGLAQCLECRCSASELSLPCS